MPVPFRGRTLDADALAGYARWMAAQPVAGVAVNVHTGRGRHLAEQARRQVLGIWRAALPDRVLVAGAWNVASASEARELGADAVLAFAPKAQDPVAYHEALSRELPVIAFYLYPAAGGADYDDATLRAVLELPGVLGIKVATLDSVMTFQRIAALCRDAAAHPAHHRRGPVPWLLAVCSARGPPSSAWVPRSPISRLPCCARTPRQTGRASSVCRKRAIASARPPSPQPMEGYVRRMLWAAAEDGAIARRVVRRPLGTRPPAGGARGGPARGARCASGWRLTSRASRASFRGTLPRTSAMPTGSTSPLASSDAPVPHPIGKGSGQLSLNLEQLETDRAAGLAFVVLKTLIGEDAAGVRSMEAWAIHETRMRVERRRAPDGREGWTVTWKGRGWDRSLGEYLDFVRASAPARGGVRRHPRLPVGQAASPAAGRAVPRGGVPRTRWRRSPARGAPGPLPVEKDFSPTLAGDALADERARVLRWIGEVPALIRRVTPGGARVQLKLMNARFDDGFQREMLAAASGADGLTVFNRLFDPAARVAYGGWELSDRNLRALEAARAADSVYPGSRGAATCAPAVWWRPTHASAARACSSTRSSSFRWASIPRRRAAAPSARCTSSSSIRLTG